VSGDFYGSDPHEQISQRETAHGADLAALSRGYLAERHVSAGNRASGAAVSVGADARASGQQAGNKPENDDPELLTLVEA
jgi:hypothetical protein